MARSFAIGDFFYYPTPPFPLVAAVRNLTSAGLSCFAPDAVIVAMDTAPETHLDKLASRMSASENLADGASALSPLSSDSLLSIHYRVLDMMAEGVTVSDEDGIIQYTNAAEDEMFGYGRGELSGLPVGVQNAREVDGAPPLRTAGAWREEQLNRKKDGTFFGTRATISSLEVSGKRYRVCVHEDITERRR
jgi:PAS domain S-box-containing protein